MLRRPFLNVVTIKRRRNDVHVTAELVEGILFKMNVYWFVR